MPGRGRRRRRLTLVGEGTLRAQWASDVHTMSAVVATDVEASPTVSGHPQVASARASTGRGLLRGHWISVPKAASPRIRADPMRARVAGARLPTSDLDKSTELDP